MSRVGYELRELARVEFWGVMLRLRPLWAAKRIASGALIPPDPEAKS